MARSLLSVQPLVNVTGFTNHYDKELGKYRNNLRKYKPKSTYFQTVDNTPFGPVSRVSAKDIPDMPFVMNGGESQAALQDLMSKKF
mmetsp:Transcript_15601/g.23935  ORF Transcript_15601/g.23935 Transcript_15601/m.23935 type:complete len:86 (+) Transcript_15601:315-572(+)